MSSESSLETRQQQIPEILAPDTEVEDSNGHKSDKPQYGVEDEEYNPMNANFVPCTQDPYDNACTTEMKDGDDLGIGARKMFGASAPSTNGSPTPQPAAGDWRRMQNDKDDSVVQSTSGTKTTPPLIQLESSLSEKFSSGGGSSSNEWHLHLESDTQATQEMPVCSNNAAKGHDDEDAKETLEPPVEPFVVNPPPEMIGIEEISNDSITEEPADGVIVEPQKIQEPDEAGSMANEEKETVVCEIKTKNGSAVIEGENGEKTVIEIKEVEKTTNEEEVMKPAEEIEEEGEDDDDESGKLEISSDATPSRGSGRGRGRGRGRGARGRRGGWRGRGRGRGTATEEDEKETAKETKKGDDETEPKSKQPEQEEVEENETPTKVNIGTESSEEKDDALTPPKKRRRRGRRSTDAKETPRTDLRSSLRSQSARSEEKKPKQAAAAEESDDASMSDGEKKEEEMEHSDEEDEKDENKSDEGKKNLSDDAPRTRGWRGRGRGRGGRGRGRGGGRPPASSPTTRSAVDSASKRRRTSSSAHSTDNEASEGRQLRKRVPKPETPPVAPPPPKLAESTPSSAKRRRGGRRGGARNVGSPQSTDPYKFDDNLGDVTPLPPLKHVHVARSSFGDVKYTKSPTTDKGSASKYVHTSKVAERRQQASPGLADTQILDVSNSTPQNLLSQSSSELSSSSTPYYELITESKVTVNKRDPKTNEILRTTVVNKSPVVETRKKLTPSLHKAVSPNKPSLSTGELADVSSLGSTKSTPSEAILANVSKTVDEVVEHTTKTRTRVSFENPRDRGEYTAIKKMDTKRVSSGSSGSSRVAGSYSLFSDVEQKISDDFDAEDFLTDKSSPRTNSRRKSALPQGEDSEDDDLHEIHEIYDDEENYDEQEEFVSSRQPKRSRSGGDEMGAESSTPPVKKRRRRTTDKVTPKPKEPELEAKTPDEQLAADFPQSHAQLMPGARVLARWVDKTFYPANVIVFFGLGRYKIRFIDGNYRDLPHTDLVPVADLKAGDVLMVSVVVDGEDELQPVTIKNTPPSNDSQDWYDGIFEVENQTTGEIERVPWKKLVIDVDQRKAFVSTSINKYAQDIVSDNISDSRVRRTRGVRSNSPSTSADVDSGSEKRVGTPQSAAAGQRTPSSRGRGGGGRGTRGGRGRGRGSRGGTPASPDVASSDERRTPRGIGTPRGAGRGRGGRGRGHGRGGSTTYEVSSGNLDETARTPTNVVTITRMAQRREPLDQMFHGLKFVLTSANRTKNSKDPSSSDASEEERPLISFNKKQVRQMIDERGGTVVEEFLMLADTSSNCFLVADQHYRTHKYLSALARAVPCVSHMWIHDSCSQNKLLPHKNYILPAGQSLESNQIIEWHDKCPSLLSGLNVYVYTENRPNNPAALDFVQIWSPLVRCMGATVVNQIPDPDEQDAHLDLLLTDVSCPNQVLTAAAEIGASAVSSEWLIQAIITGLKPEANGHPKYRYDYIEQVSP